ncbi:MAG: hypothetical protein A4E31_00072 [Methanomassiliicoccales archaeon PtaU1.Bin030]|nr:MAG: hypothetical protein A4E31_00072 [Methanomassiliicoccales archaeon PtaU1.Bin030]
MDTSAKPAARRKRALMAEAWSPSMNVPSQTVPSTRPRTQPMPPTLLKLASCLAQSSFLKDSKMSTVPTGAAAVTSTPMRTLAIMYW